MLPKESSSFWGATKAIVRCAINAGSLSQYFSGNILENIQKVAQNISNALTIIVAAVPEGLPLIVKLVTKQNVSTMEKFNILAKNTGKIPELAYVNLICTDKTGTLTTGEMTSTVMINGNCQDIFNKESSLNELIDLNICMNNSAVFDSNGNITGGNSIDRAVLDMLSPEDAQKIQNKAIMKKRVPFSSENKFSAVTLNNGANDFTVYKGAPEKLIEKCKFYLDNDGIATELTEEKRKALKSHIKGLTEKAMRCIALTISDKTDDGLPDEMNLLGIIGVVDPVRNEVPEAVKIAHKARIQVIEITGDCMETAKAVAMEAGIYKPGDLAVTNDEFEAMSDVKVKEIIPQLRVISRCSPNTKLRLVTLAQEIGMSVAMTGDGVNDAPALKKADVGFGMQDGSDVAKEAADIVLTDNNFASVVKAVELGRTFMHNIMMFLEFQLPINISLLILSMVFPIISGGSALLAAVQILIVNIIMDSLNSLSFGGEPPKEEYMNEEPIMKGSGLFIRGAKGRIALSSIVFIALFGVITFGPVGNMFATKLSAMTARFALLCLMAVFNGFTIRTDSMNLFKGIKNNKLFVYIALGIFAMAVVLCNFVGNLVQTTPMDVKQWIVVLVTAFMVVPVDWIRKTICKKGSN